MSNSQLELIHIEQPNSDKILKTKSKTVTFPLTSEDRALIAARKPRGNDGIKKK